MGLIVAGSRVGTGASRSDVSEPGRVGAMWVVGAD